MWVRSELKSRAKTVLNLCYWKAVLVSLILVFITGSSGGSSGGSNSFKDDDFLGLTNNGGINSQVVIVVLGILLMLIFVGIIIGITLGVFVFNPLEVNARRFFILSRVRPTSLGELGFSFNHSYLNVVKVQFFRYLFTFLWSLLFIIPGIIKGYEYRMIPYLLAENPGMQKEEAFRLSKAMMDGEKWKTFVLDLSFFGWYLLSILTLGILAVFYVNPYRDLTNTELYTVLKDKVVRPAEETYAGY